MFATGTVINAAPARLIALRRLMGLLGAWPEVMSQYNLFLGKAKL
jgi:hypothetical protein